MIVARPRSRRALVVAVLVVAVLVVAVLVGVLPGSGDGDRTPPRAGAPEHAGLSRAVGPVDRACDGIEVTTSQDPHQVLAAHPPGTTFCLAPGTHRVREPLEPEAGDSLIGRRGAVLSGSIVLTGWQRQGTTWSARGELPEDARGNGHCLPTVPLCVQAQDVFHDRRRLRPVASKALVTPGTVHADHRTDTVTIGDDPRLHLVEQAVAPSLVRADVDGVTVANLVLEQAASEAQTGAVEARRGSRGKVGTGWRILDNEVRLNHGVGVGVGSRSTVSGNYLHHQGQLGLGVAGAGTVVTNNEIAFNGVAGYSAEWEAGGSKSWATDDETVSHNYVHDNLGPGLWTDGGARNVMYEFNRVVDNWGAGIQYEISYDAIIRYNEISGNGRVHKGWLWEAGIQIQSSGGTGGGTGSIEVAHNVLSDNANGIVLIDSGDRAENLPVPHGPHVVRNVWVHNNTVTMLPGQVTGAVQDTGDHSIFSAGNRFDANIYHLVSLTEHNFAWTAGEVGWDEWQGYGQGNDPHGRAELFVPPGSSAAVPVLSP